MNCPRTIIFACLGLFSCLESIAIAQGVMPDGLDGGAAWAMPVLSLPAFPAFTQDSVEICWLDCDVEMSRALFAEFGAPRPARMGDGLQVDCVFVSRLVLKEPVSGAVEWVGTMRMWYSRTWQHVDFTGNEFQVWRFLLNGDLVLRTALPAPCLEPPCTSAFGGRVHCWGYVDYALELATGRFTEAWALNHDCDRIHHRAGFSRAGTFHPDRSYNFVGPSTNFNPSTGIPAENSSPPQRVLNEDFRPLDLTVLPASGAVCRFEEAMRDGLVDFIANRCPCGGALTRSQYARMDLNATGASGTSVSTASRGTFISKAVGWWSTFRGYPGLQYLRMTVAAYVHEDPCRPGGRSRREIFFGVSSIFDDEASVQFQINARGVGDGMGNALLDQGNSMRFPSLEPLANSPYVTDFVLNFSVLR